MNADRVESRTQQKTTYRYRVPRAIVAGRQILFAARADAAPCATGISIKREHGYRPSGLSLGACKAARGMSSSYTTPVGSYLNRTSP